MNESMNELNLERLKTNPASATEEDFNPGPLDCKSSALPTHGRIQDFRKGGCQSASVPMGVRERGTVEDYENMDC